MSKTTAKAMPTEIFAMWDTDPDGRRELRLFASPESFARSIMENDHLEFWSGKRLDVQVARFVIDDAETNDLLTDLVMEADAPKRVPAYARGTGPHAVNYKAARKKFKDEFVDKINKVLGRS